jgi:hypothetical protein
VAVTPANRPEREAAKMLLEEIEGRGQQITELQIDRGYLGEDEIERRRLGGMQVISKPFRSTTAAYSRRRTSGSISSTDQQPVPTTLSSLLHSALSFTFHRLHVRHAQNGAFAPAQRGAEAYRSARARSFSPNYEAPGGPRKGATALERGSL